MQAPAPTFDQRVYAVVAQIPCGQLATYGQIAELVGVWGAARQVGWALRRLPLPSEIPWMQRASCPWPSAVGGLELEQELGMEMVFLSISPP